MALESGENSYCESLTGCSTPSLSSECCLPSAVSKAAQPAASTGRDSPQTVSTVCRVKTAALPPLSWRVSAATDKQNKEKEEQKSGHQD